MPIREAYISTLGKMLVGGEGKGNSSFVYVMNSMYGADSICQILLLGVSYPFYPPKNPIKQGLFLSHIVREGTKAPRVSQTC